MLETPQNMERSRTPWALKEQVLKPNRYVHEEKWDDNFIYLFYVSYKKTYLQKHNAYQ
jgi:hypothetical protein